MADLPLFSEPTMKALLSSVQIIRQHLGFETVVTHSKPGDKGRSAQVERAIQTLRRQASTLVAMAEEKCGLRLHGDHPLISWSYIHAAWTLNRFSSPSATKISPFELVYGRRYAGKIAAFGEVVMVLHRRGPNVKQGPQWVPGVWVGKTEVEDLHVVCTPEGVARGKAIRILCEAHSFSTYWPTHFEAELWKSCDSSSCCPSSVTSLWTMMLVMSKNMQSNIQKRVMKRFC
jgi:hypothetical protein